ncbi:HTH_Tnp_Tc3_2 domain-containing protein [Trichonephila clavipes]|nr:HTH_Tnp_Tc3_2 domain-containing protein [Trichonephila clavipes]
MCLVVLFTTLGSIPKDSVSRNLFQADHELQHLQKTVCVALSARRNLPLLNKIVLDHFQQRRRISATTVRNRLHNEGLYARRPICKCSPNGRQRRNRLCWAREHVSWTQQQWASRVFTDESRFTWRVIQGVY